LATAPADDFEERKKELLRPVLFEAGAALLDCQGFEFGIALLLFHFSRLGTVGLQPEKVSLILDDKEKKTAGQLVAMLKKHVKVSEGIETALEEALIARNYLIHRILIDNVEKLERAESRAELVREIRKQRAKVRKVHERLGKFIMAFSEALDGRDQEKMERELRERLS
jgi:hypothetical protein